MENPRPGGALAARPLHLFLVLDTSGSMADDGKIQALNNAVREAVPHLRDVANSNPHARLLVRVLTFSTGARWHVAEARPVDSFVWRDVTAEGYTDIGAGLALLSEQLTSPPMDRRAFPPVIVVVSDGQATDDFDAGLARLLGEPWGRRAVRAAIAIGRDADTEMLRRFSSDQNVLEANNPEQLVRMVRFASTIAARSASEGVPAPDGEPRGVVIPVLSAEPADESW
jgi:uncharacterized protein YegL